MERKFAFLLFILKLIIRSVFSDDKNEELYNGKSNEYEENLKVKFGCIPPDDYKLIKQNSNDGFVSNLCLPKDYQVKEPPATDTNVGVIFHEKRILNINERRRSLTLIIALYLFWEDSRVKYLDPQHKNQLSLPDITTTHDYIWTPFTDPDIGDLRQIAPVKYPVIAKIGLMDGKSANHIISKNVFSLNSTIIVARTIWKIKVFCRFDFSKYPFDEQMCHVGFFAYNLNVTIGKQQKSWGYEREKQLDFGGYDLKREYFNSEPEYIKELQASVGYIGFKINMTRQIETYFYQYYLPCITIVVTSIFSFIVPLTAIPGRVMIVVTQFLTLTTVFSNAMVRNS